MVRQGHCTSSGLWEGTQPLGPHWLPSPRLDKASSRQVRGTRQGPLLGKTSASLRGPKCGLACPLPRLSGSASLSLQTDLPACNQVSLLPCCSDGRPAASNGLSTWPSLSLGGGGELSRQWLGRDCPVASVQTILSAGMKPRSLAWHPRPPCLSV